MLYYQTTYINTCFYQCGVWWGLKTSILGSSCWLRYIIKPSILTSWCSLCYQKSINCDPSKWPESLILHTCADPEVVSVEKQSIRHYEHIVRDSVIMLWKIDRAHVNTLLPSSLQIWKSINHNENTAMAVTAPRRRQPQASSAFQTPCRLASAHHVDSY
jgi:hypothetical protein